MLRKVPVLGRASSGRRAVGLGMVTLGLAVPLCFAQPASALSIDYELASITFDLDNSDPDQLTLWADTSVSDGLSIFTLGDGDSYAFEAFTIGSFDDRSGSGTVGVTRDVSATFSWIQPDGAVGTVEGTAFATWKPDTGNLDWAGPVMIDTGSVVFEVALSNVSFDLPGSQVVTATITQNSSSAPPMPEPQSALLFVVGGVVLAGAQRRRSRRET